VLTDPFRKVFSLQSFLFASQKESGNPPSILLLSRRRKRGESLFSTKIIFVKSNLQENKERKSFKFQKI